MCLHFDPSEKTISTVKGTSSKVFYQVLNYIKRAGNRLPHPATPFLALAVLVRQLVPGTPKTLISAAIIVAGIFSHLASEVGYAILIPLGAMIFHALGRHPMAGFAAAFCDVGGGFGSILIRSVDPILAGLSTSAAHRQRGPLWPPYSSLCLRCWATHPALTQATFRVGDSVTNIITPTMSSFALIVTYAKKHEEKYGIGTIIFPVVWLILIFAWMQPGSPVGFDSPLRLGS